MIRKLKAKAPKELLAEYTHAIEQAAKILVQTTADAFAGRPKKDRDEAHAKAAAIDVCNMRRSSARPIARSRSRCLLNL
jgi:hypothetical protein